MSRSPRLTDPRGKICAPSCRSCLSGLGIPAIHVTHDRDEALTIGDEVAIVVAGKVRQLASPHEIVANPADEACARLLGWSELGVGR